MLIIFGGQRGIGVGKGTVVIIVAFGPFGTAEGSIFIGAY
jgi:hypothetical protein